MNSANLVAQIRSIRARLGESDGLFDVGPLEVAEPMGTQGVAAFEAAVGIKLPVALAEHFGHASERVYFQWRTVEEVCEQLGYPEEAWHVEATLSLALPPLEQTHRHVGICLVTRDHFGNGWALDYRWGIEPVPMVWFQHDGWMGDDEEPEFDSFEEMWTEFAEYGFLSRPDSSGSLVYEFLARGALPPPSEV